MMMMISCNTPQSPLEVTHGLEINEILKASRSYPLSFDYPDGSWGLAVDSCKFVGQLIRTLRPKRVLEFGSGWSTMVIASELCSINGAQLYSVDHQAAFQAITKNKIDESGLAQWVTFYRFPIRPGWYAGKCLLFYRVPHALRTQIADLDLVLVDGPPYYWGREMAFYTVFAHLKIGGLVLLDDVTRSEEKRNIQEWLRYYGPALEYMYIEGLRTGLAIFKKVRSERVGEGFSIYGSYRSLLDTIRRVYINRQRLREWL